MKDQMTIQECIEWNDCAYLVCVCKDDDVIQAEIQRSDYWVGGDEGGYTDNSNIYFDTPTQAQSYYTRQYKQIFVFDDERDADEKADELDN